MKSIRLNSLGLRVLLVSVAGVLLSIALIVVAASLATKSDIGVGGFEVKEHASSLAQRLKFDANGNPIVIDISQTELGWVYERFASEASYRVLDAAGTVILAQDHRAGGAGFWPDKESSPSLKPGRFAFAHNGETRHGFTKPIVHRGETWHLQFAVSTRLKDLLYDKSALPIMGASIGLFSVVLIIAFGLCAYVTLRFALKPLRDVSASASAISTRALHARLQAASVPAEISPLVESFNQTLDRLERGFRLQQEFLANAAHELKTPLGLIRAQIELRNDGSQELKALLGDVEYMTRQVQQLLHLAEVSEPRNYTFATTAIAAVAHEAVDFLQWMANTAQIRLTVSDSDVATRWSADRGALFTLLKNLLENAIEHAPRGSTVSVEIAGGSLCVRDQGEGVEAAQLPKLFDRFWRGPERRDIGAGLGLAICQEIALAHEWTLIAERAEPGLRMQLTNAAWGYGEIIRAAPKS